MGLRNITEGNLAAQAVINGLLTAEYPDPDTHSLGLLRWPGSVGL